MAEEVDGLMSDFAVATVDLSRGTPGGSGDLERGMALRSAFEGTGFVILKGVKGLDPELVARAYKFMERLFDLPVETLLRHERAAAHHQRGYTPFKVERGVGAPAADLKHHYFIGPETDEAKYENVWPEEVPGFREVFIAVYKMFEAIAYDVTRLLGLAIHMPGIESELAGSESLLRLIDYPALDGAHDPLAVRAAPHGDINFLTFLPTATAAGLEVRAVDGTWMPINAEPGDLIVNAGDVLEYIGANRPEEATRFRIPSTWHQVVNLPGRRFSMPFFSHLREKYVVNPTTGLTEGELVHQRLRDIGLAA